MAKGRLLSLLVAMLTLGALAPAWAGDALQAGYDSSHTCYTPETLSLPLTLAWKFSVPPDTCGTEPIFAENTVFHALGSCMYSLDPDTGAPHWASKVESPINGSPCYRAGKVIFGSDNGYVYALRTADGAVAWYAKVGSAVRAAPCLVDDVVYCATTDGRVTALDVNTGKPKWIAVTKEAIYSSPTVVDRLVVVAGVDRTVYGFDADSGRAKWFYTIPGQGGVYADLVSTDKQIFVLADNTLVALGLRGMPLWKLGFTAPPPSGPAFYRGVLVQPGPDGDLYGIEAATGKVAWTRPLGMYLSCGLTISGDTVFAGSDAGLVRAFNMQTGQPIWEYFTWHPLLVKSSQKADDYVPVVPPLVAGGALYVTTAAGELMKLTADAFDLSPPEVFGLTPAEGSPTKSKLPLTLSVKVYDEGSGVDTSSLSLELDGVVLPASFQPVGNEFTFTKDTPAGTSLSDGWHTVTLRAKDNRGNELVRTWKFLADANYVPPADTTRATQSAARTGLSGAMRSGRSTSGAFGSSRYGQYGRGGGMSSGFGRRRQ